MGVSGATKNLGSSVVFLLTVYILADVGEWIQAKDSL